MSARRDIDSLQASQTGQSALNDRPNRCNLLYFLAEAKNAIGTSLVFARSSGFPYRDGTQQRPGGPTAPVQRSGSIRSVVSGTAVPAAFFRRARALERAGRPANSQQMSLNTRGGLTIDGTVCRSDGRSSVAGAIGLFSAAVAESARREWRMGVRARTTAGANSRVYDESLLSFR